MKESIEVIESGVVTTKYGVSLEITLEESKELREALAIVQKYEKRADKIYRKKYKHSPRDADWCEYGYGVKNDKLIVSIRNGMAG